MADNCLSQDNKRKLSHKKSRVCYNSPLIMCYPLFTSTSKIIYLQNYKLVENLTPIMYNGFLFASEIKHLNSLLTTINVGNQIIWKKLHFSINIEFFNNQ